MKHTQGYWKVDKHPYLHVECGEQWICQLSNIEGKKYPFLSDEAEAERLKTDREKEANAQLIAAAPELLKELQWIVNEIETTPEPLSDALLGLIKLRATKVINKATQP